LEITGMKKLLRILLIYYVNTRPFPNYIFINEMDCWGARGDEDPFEAGCQASEVETVSIEPSI
jgi:hypothetical protein